jgi:mRNA interferase YafQ
LVSSDDKLLQLVITTRFRKDLKLVAKRGKDIDKLEAIINCLQAQQPLSQKHKDHYLTGNWVDHRECHIEPDWLLIYRVDDQYLSLERTGSHSDLFK